jgi:hypothetical protein
MPRTWNRRDAPVEDNSATVETETGDVAETTWEDDSMQRIALGRRLPADSLQETDEEAFVSFRAASDWMTAGDFGVDG